MVSCGYEPTAVMDGFGSIKGFWGMVRGTFRKYPEPQTRTRIDPPSPVMQETHS